MAACLGTTIVEYQKGDIVLFAGEEIANVGIVVQGSVKVISDDIKGNSTILTEVGKGDIFCEVFACAGVKISPVTVQTVQDCKIMFMNYSRIINSCSSACVFHNKIVENMLKMVASKTLMLNQKIDILSQRSIRQKVISFLNWQRKDKKWVIVPFTREEMADYLCVDRSALSSELSKMQKEKLISYNKNYFEIHY